MAGPIVGRLMPSLPFPLVAEGELQGEVSDRPDQTTDR